jgi:hypothetical protein
MCKIAVFTDEASGLCDFFDASRLVIFEKTAGDWVLVGEAAFEKIVPSTPVETRRLTEKLLPLLAGCDVLAGGALVGIPYSVFDRAGLHIFEIGGVSDAVFDGVLAEVQSADSVRHTKEQIVAETRPVETAVPGVFALDLIALQRECPEISSKKAMADFLRDTPFLELRLLCGHIPPWIENSGQYDVRILDNKNGAVQAAITRRC